MSSHILLADDDHVMRTMLAALLRSADYTVQTASNGAEALAAMEQEWPSLLLLDMKMPVLDGWGVARGMRERGQWVPTIVMTAGGQVMGIEAEMGAQGSISKPFDIDELLAVIEHVRSQA